MNYDFRTFSPGADRALTDQWVQAVHQGFHEARPSKETLTRYRRRLVGDDAVLQGVYRPTSSGPELPVDRPVATFASFEGTVTMPSQASLANHMITDVTVSPAHRRRGLLRGLMTEDLAAAARAGTPMATLTASEATIYSRFGFGVITEYQAVEVDTSFGFALHPGIRDAGSVEMAEARELAPAAREVFDEFHRRTPGSVERPFLYDDYVTGEWDFDKGGAVEHVRAAIHRDPSGTIDGYVCYTFDGWEKQPLTMQVRDLITTTDEAYLGLWTFLGSLDLSERIRTDWPSPSDPLPWALADRQRYRVTNRGDSVWARVLDPIRCLENVAWRGTDRLVLDVSDPLGHAEGNFAVSVHDGGLSVARTEESGDVVLDVDTLATLIFGTVAPSVLHAAGRLRASAENLQRLHVLAASTAPPQSLSRF